MTEPNKIKGIVKNISEKTKGVVLLLPDQSETWWNPIGENVKKFITPDLRGNEVELTIVNQEKRLFSFLKVVKVQEKENKNTITSLKGAVSENEARYRAMAVSYAKDLVIGEKLEKKELLDGANSIFSFIIGGK